MINPNDASHRRGRAPAEPNRTAPSRRPSDDRRRSAPPSPALPPDLPGAADLFMGFRPYVMSIALNVLHNRQDAEDACQETFLSFFTHWKPEPAAGQNLHGYLRTIAFRKCLDAIRKKRRFLVFSNRLEFEIAESVRTFREEETEASRLPAAYFDRLSPKERESLALWANDDYRAPEIARKMGCTSETVRFHLFRARRKIRDRLAREEEVLHSA